LTPKLILPSAAETTKALQVLCGLRLLKIHCAGLLRIIHFSAKAPNEFDYDGEVDWAVHVDCAWRLDQHTKILTGSDDWFVTEDKTPPPEDWDAEQGGSFQEAVLRSVLADPDTSGRTIRNRTESFIVEAVEADDWAACMIGMSDGFALRIFTDASARESWRIFKPGDLSSHFVIPPQSSSQTGRKV